MFPRIEIVCPICFLKVGIGKLLKHVVKMKLHCGCVLNEDKELLNYTTNRLDLEKLSSFCEQNRIDRGDVRGAQGGDT